VCAALSLPLPTSLDAQIQRKSNERKEQNKMKKGECEVTALDMIVDTAS